MAPLPRSILYFGSNSPGSTSRHRADALRRCGCRVTLLDPNVLIGPRGKWQAFLDYRTGYRWLQLHLVRALKMGAIGLGESLDLIWIDSGDLFGPDVLKWLSARFSCPIVLYNVDDPTGSRDALRFQSLRASFLHYSLCVFVRQETALEALALGAQQVLTVHRSFDEILHAPPKLTARNQPEPVVSFIGTLIAGEARDHFLLSLLKAGLPLRLIGNRWHRSRLWPLLLKIYQGAGRTGVAYAQALGSAAVTLGLLSNQNRDLITTRSLETPACGGLLCAERTSEHQLLFEDGHEAVFWSSTEECIAQCRHLLEDFRQNRAIRGAGRQQVHRLGVGNEDICRQILSAI